MRRKNVKLGSFKMSLGASVRVLIRTKDIQVQNVQLFHGIWKVILIFVLCSFFSAVFLNMKHFNLLNQQIFCRCYY